MQNQLTPLIITHASVGSIMLITGIIAMSARKANNYHRIAGKIYLVAATTVACTGFTIAVEKNNQFLIAASVFVLYMVMTAYRSLYLKQLYKEVKAQTLDWLIIAFGVISSVSLLVLGGITVAHGNLAGLVPLTFGSISALFARRDILKFVKGPVDRKYWLYNHIAGMVGSYIAATTAFLAVNAGYVSHHFSLLVWLSPTVIGTPLIIYWIRKYKTKPADLSKELKLRISPETL